MFAIDPLASGQAVDGSLYPSRWCTSQGIDLVVVPVLADQELNVTVRYWGGRRGLCWLIGSEGEPVGAGYVDGAMGPTPPAHALTTATPVSWPRDAVSVANAQGGGINVDPMHMARILIIDDDPSCAP